MTRLEQLNAMLKESPNDSFLLFAIAKEYEKINSWERAIQFYEKVVENDSNYVGVYYHLGAVQAELGNTDLAMSTYKKGIQICKALGDHHALSELKSVLMNLEIED